MARIIAIDYGLKRTGLAVTDPMQIIATGLMTIESPKLINFLKDYFKKETVELILLGERFDAGFAAVRQSPVPQSPAMAI